MVACCIYYYALRGIILESTEYSQGIKCYVIWNVKAHCAVKLAIAQARLPDPAQPEDIQRRLPCRYRQKHHSDDAFDLCHPALRQL